MFGVNNNDNSAAAGMPPGAPMQNHMDSGVPQAPPMGGMPPAEMAAPEPAPAPPVPVAAAQDFSAMSTPPHPAVSSPTAPAVDSGQVESAINELNQQAAAAPEPVSPPMPSEPAAPSPMGNSGDDELMNIKHQALQSLAPLVDHLDQTPEEKFKTTMMMIQATDDSKLLNDAFEIAGQIQDEKIRAQALLDIVNEINYFTQHAAPAPDATPPANGL